jgi:mRNA interferase YafO
MHRDLKESLSAEKAQQLRDDFTDYKEGKKLPTTFGRDAPYDFTHNRKSLELMHVHLKLKGNFPIHLVQFRRRSGFVLVYCPGFFDPHKYLLIAIIKHFDPTKPNDTRNTDRDDYFMVELEKIAEGFREKF